MTKKTRDACGEFEGCIFPVARCSSMNSSVVFLSSGVNGYSLLILGTKVSSRLISWSYDQEGGREVVASLENTGVNSLYSWGRVTLGLDFSAAAANSVAVVSLAIMGE